MSDTAGDLAADAPMPTEPKAYALALDREDDVWTYDSDRGLWVCSGAPEHVASWATLWYALGPIRVYHLARSTT